jgi:hypothetical protein
LRDKVKELLLMTLSSFILAVFFINVFLSTALASGTGGWVGPPRIILYAIAILFVALTGCLALATSMLAVNEAMSSGNGDTWKLSWALCIIFLFPLGLVLYFFIGRRWHKLRIPHPKPNF